MSRSLNRQIARAKERKVEALTAAAIRLYGPETKLADLHPDMQELVAYNMILTTAVIAGDDAAQGMAIGHITALMARYQTQQGDLPNAARDSGD